MADPILHTDDADPLSPEDEACELVLTFGHEYALEICADELGKASDAGKVIYWTAVKAHVEADAKAEADALAAFEAEEKGLDDTGTADL